MPPWRSAPLPTDWPLIQRRILERDGHRCTELLSDDTRCRREATDVHHMGDANDHRDAMLRAVCGWHHDRLTAAKANAARVRKTTRFPSEKHPGVM